MKRLKNTQIIPLLLSLVMVVMMAAPTMSIAAQPTVDLGTTFDYAVLAGSAVTNTGSSVIYGDLGLTPGSSVSGFPPGFLSGTQHVNDAAAIQAQVDLTVVYNDIAGRAADTIIVGDIGGQTLVPGVYKSDTSCGITGALTLNGMNDPNAIFIFQIGTTLTTASSSEVNLINGAQPHNIYWQVGSSATLGTSSDFKGNILALTSITATTTATVNGRLLARNGAVTLDTNTITITKPATLHIIKNVINDNGGTAAAGDFNMKVSGNDIAVNAPGIGSPGTDYILAAGTYVVSEDVVAGYTGSFGGDSTDGTIILAPGDNKTVTITNNDNPIPPVPAILHVIKHVVNDDGRTAVAANFTLHVKTSGGDVASSPAFGVEAPGTTYTLAAGTYVVSEDAVAGYTGSFSGDSTDGTIILAPGDNKTITITNNDKPIPSNNDDGGSTPVIYPPLINITKIPSPLALTSGQGSVTYTYKVTNPGIVSLRNVSVTDDKVSPINYISGDINNDNMLQTNETWTYTSQMDLVATTTNTATAKGSANGLTATDIAIATVVVTPATPVYPPLINITKTPAPLTLPLGHGLVTYTYKVTNPGIVALSNVSVTDDKVSLVNYVSGDVNADNLLQTNETWIYTSQVNLVATTTNTATAKGSANGMTATDIAIATVIVTPVIVDTPIVPGEGTVLGGQLPSTATPWYNLLMGGAALTLIGAMGWWITRKIYE